MSFWVYYSLSACVSVISSAHLTLLGRAIAEGDSVSLTVRPSVRLFVYPSVTLVGNATLALYDREMFLLPRGQIVQSWVQGFTPKGCVKGRYPLPIATCQLSYLYNLLQVHQPSQTLRSSTEKLLQMPYLSTDFGRLAFSYSSPATSLNSIPTSIKIVPLYTVSSATSSLTS